MTNQDEKGKKSASPNRISTEDRKRAEKTAQDETTASEGSPGWEAILPFKTQVVDLEDEDGNLGIAGPHKLLSYLNYHKTVFRCEFGQEFLFFTVGDPLHSSDDVTVCKLNEIPVVHCDGENFTIACRHLFKVGDLIDARLEDKTMVYGIPGNPEDATNSEIKNQQFDLIPALLNARPGMYLVRGPAAKIRENEPIYARDVNRVRCVVTPRKRHKKLDDGTVIHWVHLDQVRHNLAIFSATAMNFAEKNNTFVFFYNGPIDEQGCQELIKKCQEAVKCSADTEERKQVLLVLVTPGGDPHAAYRCASYLCHHFHEFHILVPGWCKSAGTLLAMGAHAIHITTFGELGPIDLQVVEKDAELMDSSATLHAALDAIRENTFQTYIRYMDDLGQLPSISLQTRSEISTKLTNGIHASITAKIDPRELGKMHRYLKLCYEYGMRLAERGANLTEAGVRKLVYDYPQHGFVIDQYEAKQLFVNNIPEDLEGFREILNLVEPLDWSLRFPLPHNQRIIETIAMPKPIAKP